MLDPTQIKQKSEQKYSIFLSSLIAGKNFFPLVFPIGSLPKEYIALRDSVTLLIDHSKQKIGHGYTLELETRKTQKYGSQSLPKQISIDTERDYLKLIKKEKEVAQFKSDVNLIQTKVPKLCHWLHQNPLKVIEFSHDWDSLLKVCLYFQQTPRPNLYIRELPIQVHTKFVEQNQKILRSLLEAILPVEHLTSVEEEKEYLFEKRFSLKYREPLIRVRLLDLSLQAKYSFPVTDMSIPMAEFRQINLGEHCCFITENLMNFLTLPALKDSFALFGSGYAVQTLKTATWLSQCPIFYWGDLDVDGFKILSQLRSDFPQTLSIMMDRATFEMFHEFAVSTARVLATPIPHLTADEEALCADLALHQNRLEQERISQDYANRFLQNLIESLPNHFL